MSQPSENAREARLRSTKARAPEEVFSSQPKGILSLPARTWCSPAYFQSSHSARFSTPVPPSESRFHWNWNVRSSQKTEPSNVSTIRSTSNALRSLGSSPESVFAGDLSVPTPSVEYRNDS